MPSVPATVQSRWGRSQWTIESSGDELRIDYRRRAWGVGCFLGVWLAGWTIGCVVLAFKVIAEPTLFQVLFALPFWAAELFVLNFALGAFLAREEFVLDRDGAVFTRRPVLADQSRRIPLDEVRRFSGYTVCVDSESDRMESGIELESLGRPLRMLQGLTDGERDEILARLNAHLKSLVGEDVDEPRVAPGGVRAVALPLDDIDPPGDCRWKRTDDLRDLVFLQRGRINPAAIGVLLFVNAFWNGIVAVFVLGLFGLGGVNVAGPGWWTQFWFLVPFELIGLVFVGLLVLALLDPFRRSMWTFADDSLIKRHAWFGIGVTRTIDLSTRLARIDLSRRKVEASVQSINVAGPPSDGGFDLVLIEAVNREVHRLRGLTEGEARWIGGSVLRERAFWFPR